MRKKFLSIILSSVLALSCVGCGTTYQEATRKDSNSGNEANGYFVVITEWDQSLRSYYIVYAKDTKVKYFITKDGYSYGITPLYNADGTLQIFEE